MEWDGILWPPEVHGITHGPTRFCALWNVEKVKAMLAATTKKMPASTSLQWKYAGPWSAGLSLQFKAEPGYESHGKDISVDLQGPQGRLAAAGRCWVGWADTQRHQPSIAQLFQLCSYSPVLTMETYGHCLGQRDEMSHGHDNWTQHVMDVSNLSKASVQHHWPSAYPHILSYSTWHKKIQEKGHDLMASNPAEVTKLI